MSAKVQVTVWNEFRHEKDHAAVRKVYPLGMHKVIAEGLEFAGGFTVRTATLDEAEHGLTAEVLAATDVLVWWAHMAHQEVSDAVVKRVQERVLSGMGLIVLHSGHFSKIFRALMGYELQPPVARSGRAGEAVEPGTRASHQRRSGALY
jgi:trehalose utilization protein